MAYSEDVILNRIVGLIRELVRLALDALGLFEARTDLKYVNVTAIWSIELWWELQIPRVVSDTGISPDVAVALRTALGGLVERLDQVQLNGGGPREVRDEVLRFQSQWEGRARRIAVTESTRIASEAVLQSTEAAKPGARKVWVTSHDRSVRPTHRIADGQMVPMGGMFRVGEDMLRYPGDPLGNPEEVVNCRCHVRINLKGGKDG
jgi:hypothetical protein